MSQSVDDVKIAHDLMFSSDHFPLTMSFSSQNRWSQTNQQRQRVHWHNKPCLPTTRNSQPNDNWYNAIRHSTLAWQDWEALPRLRELVHEHAKTRVEAHVNEELESLLEARRYASDLVTKQKTWPSHLESSPQSKETTSSA